MSRKSASSTRFLIISGGVLLLAAIWSWASHGAPSETAVSGVLFLVGGGLIGRAIERLRGN